MKLLALMLQVALQLVLLRLDSTVHKPQVTHHLQLALQYVVIRS